MGVWERNSSFIALVVKIAALFGFLGGPALLYEGLKSSTEGTLAFLISFAPLALVILGALSLGDDHRSPWSRTAVAAGICGTVVVLLLNAYGIYATQVESRHVAPELFWLGTIVGSVAALTYLQLARRFFQGHNILPEPPTVSEQLGPSPQDWAITIILAGFTGLGVFLLPRKPQVAIATLLFFGVGFAIFGLVIVRKLKESRGQIEPIQLTHGSEMSMSRTRVIGFASIALILFGGVVAFPLSYPTWVLWLAGALAVGAAAVIVLTILGVLPQGTLRFTRDALSTGPADKEIRIQWTSIHSIVVGEFNSNAIVGVTLAHFDDVTVGEKLGREKAIRRMTQNYQFFGHHLTIFAGHYGVSAPALAKAMAQFGRVVTSNLNNAS